ncbi:hypothetical protein CPC08DRAFT_766608 [Agrocybe pediades]|nr:hypothetical protein CPC08DRAFT_766608 [Agrocybe pediades]
MGSHFDSMYQIPEIPEIWDIISSYSTRTTLKNLCLVGRRSLVSVAQRHIFRNMISNTSTLVYRGPYAEPDGHETGNIPWFDELAKSHLSRYVKSWAIKGQSEYLRDDKYPNDPGARERTAALSAFLRSLPRYPNLRFLRLETITLYRRTLSLIGFITNLKSLHFENIAGAFPLTLTAPLALEEFGMVMNGDLCSATYNEDGSEDGNNSGSDPEVSDHLNSEPASSNDGTIEDQDGESNYHRDGDLEGQENVDSESGSDDDDNPGSEGAANVDQTGWTISFPGPLKSLSLKHQFCYNEYTNLVGQALYHHMPHTNLVSLLFTVSEDSGKACLIRLLKASPLLEILTVILSESYFGDVQEMQESLENVVLDRTTCPLLRDVTCCPQFAKVIVPGRHVTAFSMLTNDDFWNEYELEDVSSALRTLALDGRTLTTLEFEKTLAEEAEELLPLVETLFPGLKTLKMIVRDVTQEDLDALEFELSDSDSDHGVNTTFEDDTRVEDPDDIHHAQDQFNHCFDGVGVEPPNAELPVTSLALPPDSAHTYVGLLSKVTSGEIKLPEGLTNLELIQSRRYKRFKYTRDHELMFAMSLTHPRFEKLEFVRFGIENAYNMPWRRTSFETWKKPGWFFERDGKKFVGAMHIIPGESDGTFNTIEKEEMEVKV